MSNKTRKRRARKARSRVDRTERVQPTPESLQHYRPWTMQTLLAAGPDEGGIDADEFEAALQIVEAFKALTNGLGIKPTTIEADKIASSSHTMSDRDAMLAAVWLAWSTRCAFAKPARLVAWIEDEEPILSVVILRWACRQWRRERDDFLRQRSVERQRAVDMTPSTMLTIPGANDSSASRTIIARPPYFPVQPFSPSQARATQLFQPRPASGEIHLARHALSTTPAPSARTRRS